MTGRKGMGGHHRPNRGEKDEWLTPPDIIKACGPFDLDPCAPAAPRPWETAARSYTAVENGLSLPWTGMVWCNPPYGPDTWKWLARLAEHGNGIALVFARTETAGFFREVWGKAFALRFIEGRLFFHHRDGARASANAGAPSVLVAYGPEAAYRLKVARIPGAYVERWRVLR